ncbi:MAG TPA: hypothetical protein VMT24_18890 [Aggregatilineaceae bacterium]|jgi:hypothetical protein|nr:hypothetical protein [Aggregatilineaceae bacterium]
MSQQRTWVGASRIEQWADRLDRMSRVWRVVLSLLITLELVILLSLFIDRVLIDWVIAGDVGPGVPAWIAVILGIVFYAAGWWSLVGFDLNPNRPWHAGIPAVVYVAAGTAGLLLLAILALYGLAFGYLL